MAPNELPVLDCVKACKNSKGTYALVYTDGNSYEWKVDGATSFDANSEILEVEWGNTEQGFVKVIEENANACQDSLSFCVEIIEGTTAAFQTIPATDNNGVLTICDGQTVYFKNTSENADNHQWDFGDGIFSSDFDTKHTYNGSGTYSAKLITSSSCECSDTTTIEIIVEPLQAPEISCLGTVCEGMSSTYYAIADCGTFHWSVSSEGNITDGGGTGDDYITIVWTDGVEGNIELEVESCNGTYCNHPITATVNILPQDDISIDGPTEICKDGTAQYTVPYFEATEYVWEITGPGYVVEGQGTENILVHWQKGNWNNNDKTAQIKVSYQNCYLECGGEALLDVVLKPKFNIQASNILCEGNNFYTNAIEDGIWEPVVCDWHLTFPDGTLMSNFANNVSNISETLPGGPGLYELVAVPVNPDDYCNDSFKKQIFINEQPEAPISLDGPEQICIGSAYTYKVNLINQTGTIEWTITDGNNISYHTGTNIITHTWGSTPPYKIEVYQKVSSPYFCLSETLDMDITSISNIELNGDVNACTDGTTLYEATLVEGEYYEWTITPKDAGTLISGQGTHQPEIAWHSAGNHNVSLNICGQNLNIAVTVYPAPVLNIGDQSVCPNKKVTVNAPAGLDTYSWKDEGGNELGTNQNIDLGGGYYELTVSDDNGCVAKENFYIQTHPLPEVSLSTPDFVGFCEGETCTLYALDTEEGYSYTWYKNSMQIPGENGATLTTGDWGKFYVRITDINGCHNQSNIMELFEYCGDNVCEGGNCSGGGGGGPGCPDNLSNNLSEDITYGTYCNEVHFKNASNNFITGSTEWRFNDPNSTESFIAGDEAQHTYTKAGFYMIGMACLVEYNNLNCYIEDTALVTIPIAPEFDADTVCIGEAMSFLDKSTFITGEKIVAWNWNFGEPSSGADNTSSATNPTHTYSSSGNFLVSLTITSEYGCDAYIEKQVYVQPPPDFDFISEDEICEGTAMKFTANTSEAITLKWDFDDPTSGSANSAHSDIVYHNFEAVGTYDVSLTIRDVIGCENTFTKAIEVVPNTLSLGDITLSKATPVCEGDSIVLTAPNGGTDYLWSNGLSTQNITVKQEGIYTVSITDEDGCEFVTDEVYIDFNPVPPNTISLYAYEENSFVTTPYYDYFEACYGQELDLRTNYNFNYEYEWSSGNNTYLLAFKGDNILNPGTYEYTVTLTDTQTGCQSVSLPFTVVIHPAPANFNVSASAPEPLCEGNLIELSIDNPDPALTYYWNNDTEGTSTSVFEAGQYYAIAINENGCQSQSNAININPAPDVRLVPSGCYQRCLPDTICLPSMPDIISYQWYKDGEAVPAPEGTVADFIIEEEGVYYVELTNSNGCSAISEDLSIEEKTIEIKEGDPMLIDGQVFKDVNENGQLDSGEELMNDITIQLTKEGVIIDETLTNINGEFIFTFPIDSVEFCVIMPESLLPADYFATTDTLYCFKPELGIMKDNCTPGEGGGNDNFIFGINNICSEELYMVYEVCEDSYIYHEVTGELLFPGSHLLEYTNPGTGCLVTEYVDVIGLTEYYEQFTLEACPGESVMVGNTFVLAGTSEQVNLFTVFGCDSIIYVTVNELSTYQENLTLNACTGTEALFDNQALPIGTVQDFEYKNAAGCDSIITVEVKEIFAYTETINLQACTGTDAEFDGNFIPAGTSDVFNYTGANGCDSILTVIVDEATAYNETMDIEVCDGQTTTFDNTEMGDGETQAFTYSSEAGCDSVITVNVQAMPVLEPIISTSKSCLNIANGIISIDNVSGGQAPYQYSINGADFQIQSTFENIAPGTYTLYVQDDMVCLAEAEVTVGAIDAMDISEQELTMECGQDLLTLNALVNNLNDLSTLTFEWHDGTNSESTDIHTPGDYWVDISNECETIRQNFRVTEEAVGSGEPFMIPTAFTPNSDGINDTYCPLPRYKNMEVLSFDFQVYDRWGTRVFQSNSVNDCWDGLREGVDSELGVFVWFYTADVRVCGEDRSVFEKGNVTLIH